MGPWIHGSASLPDPRVEQRSHEGVGVGTGTGAGVVAAVVAVGAPRLCEREAGKVREADVSSRAQSKVS